jgi:pimeloyl-ACP methyl ester carboxylesterase
MQRIGWSTTAFRVLVPFACLGVWSCGGTRDTSRDRAGEVTTPANGLVTDEEEERCSTSPTAVTRTDYLVDVTSTLPRYQGLPAKLDIHRVSPVYEDGRCNGGPIHAAILVHGAATEAVSIFDLQYQDYSVMESLAWAGVETFAVNLLGYGLSTRFGLDDPCNASVGDQTRFLLAPNKPLIADCTQPDPFHFTNSQATSDQLDAVVDDVRKRVGIEKVSLFGYSRGGVVVGVYTSRHPLHVKNVILLASGFDFPTDPPDPLPAPGASLMVANRAVTFREWNQQVDNAACPGQQEPAILGPIWQSIRDRDPLGSTWGSVDPRSGQTEGVRRAPSWDIWGWNAEIAPSVEVPTLVLSGLRDATNRTEREIRLYDALGSSSKVLVKIACASHFSFWEGSTDPLGWKGPHATLHDAAAQWITSKRFAGAKRGIFSVSSAGEVTRDE